MIYSFDIFDTVLTRRVFWPAEIHLLVGRDLIADGLWSGSSGQWRDVRARAEREARAAAVTEEIDLADIRTRLESAVGPSVADRAVAAELRHELAETVGIRCTLARIATLLAEEQRVVYSSDMYLPLEHVNAMLARAGAPVAPVFLSCEVGLTKRSGALFAHIARVLNVRPAEIHHTGDHRESDYHVPHRLGLLTTLFRESRPTPFEVEVHRALVRQAPLLAATLAGGMRAQRLSLVADTGDFLVLLGTQEGGLIHIAFVLWLIGRFAACAPKKVAFLARDGYLPSRLFAAMRLQLAPQLPAAGYVYASRQALHLAGLRSPITEEDKAWIFAPAPALTFAGWHFRLGLTRAELAVAGWSAAEWAAMPAAELSFARCREACVALLESPRFLTLVLAKADAARGLAAEYLTAGLYPEKGATALVDIGWNGRMQRSLVDILTLSAEQRRQIHGFYLGILRTPQGEFGDYTAWLFDLRGERRPYYASHFHLFETLFAAPHPTTYGYSRVGEESCVDVDLNVVPILAPTDATAALWPELDRFHLAIEAIAAGIRVDPGELSATDQTLRELSRHTVALLFRAPRAAQASAFRGMTFSSDQTDLDKQQLVHTLSWRQQYRCFVDTSFKLSANHWREGQLALADAPALRLGYRLSSVVRLWIRKQLTLGQLVQQVVLRYRRSVL